MDAVPLPPCNMVAPHPLHRILHPGSVAILGASEDPGKFGGRALRHVVQHGFAGRIVPVSPSAPTLLGHPAYARVGDAPGPIDVALLALPAPALPAALEECGRAGVGAVVVLTADFAETGPAGAARQAELVAIARRHAMRLIGPNCLGFIAPAARLALTSSVALARGPMPEGAIGLVSQSGSLMASLISHAQDMGAGFTAAVSIGNQADLEACDFIEYFIADPATRAVCAYLEGLRDPQRFLAVARRCREARKPLLVVKAGTSDAGAAITQSHTASLAGSHAVWEAACREHGVILLDDPESLIHCAHFLVAFGAPAADGVAALSPSGGTIAITADRIAAAGLPLATPGPATRDRLATLFPAHRPLNPLDVGGLPREQGIDGARVAFEALAADPAVGILLVVIATTPQLEAKVRLWGEAALATGKPTAILFTPGRLVDGARAQLRALGCPFTDRMDDALRVMRAALDWRRALAAARPATTVPTAFPDAASLVGGLAPGHVTEPAAKALLARAGIRTPSGRLARNADDAARAASEAGFPVALKAVCRELVHKSDAGGVALGLADAAAVHVAWEQIASSVRAALPGAALDGCLVERMADGGVEMIVGARHDPQFGPVIVVGAGGILVELLRDAQTALAPVSPERARELVAKLAVFPVLAGARGRPAADLTALADAIARVSWLAARLGPRLVELDINPLLATPAGVVALDARATLAPPHDTREQP